MKTASISILFMLGLMTGCSTAPQKVEFVPLGPQGGYSDNMESRDRFAVRYTGSAKMTGTTVRDLTLLHCAQVTVANGFNWFVIEEKVDESGHNLLGTEFSGVSRTQTKDPTGTGGTGSGTFTKTESTTRFTDTEFISQYRYQIRCFKEDPGLAEAQNALNVALGLKTKYGL